MDGRTMRTLAEYIAELHRRDRDSHRICEQPGFDTTLNSNVYSEQRDRDGDERHSKDNTG